VDKQDQEGVPPLLVQESQGGYEEEVQKIIDEITAAIDAGLLKTRQEAWTALEDRCRGSLYASDYTLCLTTLLWAGQRMKVELPAVKMGARQLLNTDTRRFMRRVPSFMKLG